MSLLDDDVGVLLSGARQRGGRPGGIVMFLDDDVGVLLSGARQRGGRPGGVGPRPAEPAVDPEGGRHPSAGEPAHRYQPGAADQRDEGGGAMCRGARQHGVSGAWGVVGAGGWATGGGARGRWWQEVWKE